MNKSSGTKSRWKELQMVVHTRMVWSPSPLPFMMRVYGRLAAEGELKRLVQEE